MGWTAIGQNTPKPDARSKVTGEARFAGDLHSRGQLYAKAVRSPCAHALVRSIETGAALSIPGVEFVLTAADIPGQNRVGMTGAKDQRVLADGKVRFLGEAVAVVAAASEEAAEKAVRAVTVVYEELEMVETPERALEPGAPVIGDKSNLCVYKKVVRGNLEKGLAEADLVIHGEYRCAPVEHAYIEPEAVLVEPDNGGLLVWSTTKSVHLDRAEIARVLGWPLERINVAAPAIGGSFGGKSDLAQVAMAALVASRAGRPVVMKHSREESFQATSKRHACVIRHTHAAKKDGTLTAVRMDLVADAGAYIDYTSVVLPRMSIFGAGPYRVSNVMLEVRGVHTNNPVAGAMRGFGQPQVAFACERQMDKLANALGMDPFELRLKNALVDRDLSATGQRLEGVTMRPVLEKARELVLEEGLGGPLKHYERRAWGMAAFYYGNGRTGLPNPGVAWARVSEIGIVEVFVGSPDIGQGSNTVLAQIAAATLDFPVSSIRVVTADTRCTPDSGTTSGTRLTAIVGKSVQLAASELKHVVLEKARLLYRAKGSLELVYGPEGPEVKGEDLSIPLPDLFTKADALLEASGFYDPPVVNQDEDGQGSPYAFYSYGIQCARARVNTYTGKVSVDKIVAVFDAGTVVNPTLLTAQIEGAVGMGMGYALSEEIRLFHGKVTNPNFDTYIVPTSMDMPEMKIVMMEVPDKEGPFGAKGIGEPALVPTAAAVANAVSRALDCDCAALPLSLEEVARLSAHTEEVGKP